MEHPIHKAGRAAVQGSMRLRCAGAAVLCHILVFVILGCGIPTTEFLGAPDSTLVEYNVQLASLSFPHNNVDNTTDNFLGYELYYKFYEHSSQPLDNEFGSDLSAVNNSAPGSGKTTLDDRGFFRIRESVVTGVPGEVDQPPLLPVDSGDRTTAFEVRVKFPDVPLSPVAANLQTHLIADGSEFGPEIELARAREASPLEIELGFESNDISIAPPDLDVPSGIITRDTPLQMAIVILAYGTNFTGGTFATLYSDPLMIELPLEIVLQ